MHRSHKGLETGNRYRESILRNYEFTGVDYPSVRAELWQNPRSGAVQMEPSLAPSRASSVVTLAPFCPPILPRVPSRFLLLNRTIDCSETVTVLTTEGPKFPSHGAHRCRPSDLGAMWGILGNAEGVGLPQWDCSLGKFPLIVYFFPCYGSQGSLRPSCFR